MSFSSFFDNSPTRQNFLKVVIDALAPDDNRKRKLLKRPLQNPMAGKI